MAISLSAYVLGIAAQVTGRNRLAELQKKTLGHSHELGNPTDSLWCKTLQRA
jgi:hypothetical protein